MITWWLFLSKRGTVRLLSELSTASTLLEALTASQTVWEVSAESAWHALSLVVVHLNRVAPHPLQVPKLIAKITQEA